EVFQHDLQFAALLTGGFVVPLVELEAAFHKEGAAAGAELRDVFALFVPGLDVNEGDFLAGGAGGVPELAVDRQAELTNRGALGRDAQFGVAGQVAEKDDFVVGGHRLRWEDAVLSSPRSEGLDEGAIDAVVELEAILEVGRARGGGGEVDLHVVGGGELRVGDADEVAAAEILDLGDFTLGFGDDGFDAIDELIDG